MTAPAPRPWWKKKRWGAALAVWLAAAYPASVGPADYAVARGWLSSASHEAAYTPLRAAVEDTAAEGPLGRYETWFLRLGLRHHAVFD